MEAVNGGRWTMSWRRHFTQITCAKAPIFSADFYDLLTICHAQASWTNLGLYAISNVNISLPIICSRSCGSCLGLAPSGEGFAPLGLIRPKITPGYHDSKALHIWGHDAVHH
jgi:hypothetical protein